jgi:hypothetical protein
MPLDCGPELTGVTAEAQGFKHLREDNIVLQVDSTVWLDIKLELGAVTQEVTGAPPILESQKTDVGLVMGERNIEAVPLRGRNITMLYDFTPGVVSGQGGNLDVTENPSGFEGAMVHGMWQDNNSSSGILAPSRRCAFCPPSFSAVSGRQGQGPLPLKLRLDGNVAANFDQALASSFSGFGCLLNSNDHTRSRVLRQAITIQARDRRK